MNNEQKAEKYNQLMYEYTKVQNKISSIKGESLNLNQNQIIRRSSFNSMDVNRYGKENNIITLSTGAYAQKVYNKISQAPSVKSGGIITNPALPVEKRIPVFYKIKL